MNIDLDNLKKSELWMWEYLFLQMIYEGIDTTQFNFGDSFIPVHMQEKGYIKILEDSIEPRQKLIDLFESKNNINFDEFWNVFPASTRSGRPLRAANKEFGGKLTRDYEVCRKKYLSKVKTEKLHHQVVDIVVSRVASNDIEYMNNMETYINKSVWEVDAKYLGITKRANKMINE
jgi:hypothetical protein